MFHPCKIVPAFVLCRETCLVRPSVGVFGWVDCWKWERLLSQCFGVVGSHFWELSLCCLATHGLDLSRRVWDGKKSDLPPVSIRTRKLASMYSNTGFLLSSYGAKAVLPLTKSTNAGGC